jgi:endonuclease YncB( thermonuclease family)
MRLRRYEILLPLFYNDGKMVEKELLKEALAKVWKMVLLSF